MKKTPILQRQTSREKRGSTEEHNLKPRENVDMIRNYNEEDSCSDGEEGIEYFSPEKEHLHQDITRKANCDPVGTHNVQEITHMMNEIGTCRADIHPEPVPSHDNRAEGHLILRQISQMESMMRMQQEMECQRKSIAASERALLDRERELLARERALFDQERRMLERSRADANTSYLLPPSRNRPTTPHTVLEVRSDREPHTLSPNPIESCDNEQMTACSNCPIDNHQQVKTASTTGTNSHHQSSEPINPRTDLATNALIDYDNSCGSRLESEGKHRTNINIASCTNFHHLVANLKNGQCS